MSSVVPLAMSQWSSELVRYFRSRNAISPDTAISFDYEEFTKSSKFYLQPPKNGLLEQPYIKTEGNDNYYLDEIAFKIYSGKWRKIGLIILAVVIFLLTCLFALRFNT